MMKNQHLYAPEGYFEIKPSYRLKQPLSFEVVEHGIVNTEDAKYGGDFIDFYKNLHSNGLVLDKNRRYVLCGANHRYPIGARSDNTKHLITEPVKRHKKAIYLGCVIRHWGHFLVEGISRWWFLLQDDKYKDYELCYVVYGQERDFMLQIMDMFGLDKNRLKRLERNTEYAELIIPEVSTEFKCFWTDEYKKTISKIKENITPVFNDKIYLSRTKFGDRILGEKIVEKTFKKNGYKIIYPERLPIKKQLSIFMGANNIACISGTTAHNLIFAREGTKCAILERGMFPNIAQFVFNDMNNLDVSYIKANFCYLPASDGYGPFLVGITPYLEQYFKENNLKYDIKYVNFYHKYETAYQKLWNYVYTKLCDDRTILFDCPQICKADIAKARATVKSSQGKIVSDKKIKDIEHIKPSIFRFIRKEKNGIQRTIYLFGIKIFQYKQK